MQARLSTRGYSFFHSVIVNANNTICSSANGCTRMWCSQAIH